MSATDDLRAKVDRLRSQLRDAETSYNNARIAEFEIQPGQIFINLRGKRAQVVRLVVKHDSVRVMLSVFRKDGMLSTLETEMWGSWKAETP